MALGSSGCQQKRGGRQLEGDAGGRAAWGAALVAAVLVGLEVLTGVAGCFVAGVGAAASADVKLEQDGNLGIVWKAEHHRQGVDRSDAIQDAVERRQRRTGKQPYLFNSFYGGHHCFPD